MLQFFVSRTSKGMDIQFVEVTHVMTICYELSYGDSLTPDQMHTVFYEVEDEDSYIEWVTELGDLDYHCDSKYILGFYFRLVVETEFTYIEVFDLNMQLVYQVEITPNMVGLVLDQDSWTELDQVLIQRFVAGAMRTYAYADQY